MNGGQDLGGMMGFGPVRPEPNEPVFHADWEKRVIAMALAMGFTGEWSIDGGRYAREILPPPEYMTSRYYDIWLKALELQVVQHGLVTSAELASGKAESPPKPVARTLAAKDVAPKFRTGFPSERPASVPALYTVGDTILTRNMHPAGHTRLPRYARGRLGRIETVHGVFVFPDTSAHGKGEAPQWMYTVGFDAAEIWGESAEPGQRVTIAAFESYSLARNGAFVSRPPEPGPFASPWEAQVFALVVSLQDAGLFTWSEWSRTLGATIRPDNRAEQTAGYGQWLEALETILAAHGVADLALIEARSAAFERAAAATPHGQPVLLRNDPLHGRTAAAS